MLFAQRIAAFGTRLIAYDPYIQPARAAQLGVRLVGLEELLRESDFISIHLPKTPETVGLIGEKELAIVKPGVRIVNAARGGLVDEQALADAIAEGRVAGAGVDVYAKEPCTDLAAVRLRQRGGHPAPGRLHRRGAGQGRSRRGQVASSSRCRASSCPDAVNVQAGGVVAEDVRPLLPLAEKLGRAFTAAGRRGGRQRRRSRCAARSPPTTCRCSSWPRTKGLFSSVVEEQVTYVNAPHLAAERGVEVTLATPGETVDHPNLVTVRGALPDGRTVRVSGTVVHTGARDVFKLTEVDGFDVEIGAEGILVFLRYADRPGVVGTVGTLLGEAGVNIAAMQVARREAGGETLMTLTVDQALGADLLTSAADSIGAVAASAADLRDV